MRIDKYTIIYTKGAADLMTQIVPAQALWVPPAGTVIVFPGGVKEIVGTVEFHPVVAEIWVRLAR